MDQFITVYLCIFFVRNLVESEKCIETMTVSLVEGICTNVQTPGSTRKWNKMAGDPYNLQ